MFKIIQKSKKNKARIIEIGLPHGFLRGPFFMPDATRAVVKNLGISDLEMLGMPAMVVNTLHLYLQPGVEPLGAAGGVNEFMKFDKPLLSDSGGFQVFSLIHNSRGSKPMGKITDDGAIFKSPLDGSKHELTPEKSIQIQFDLGTDMMVVLDDCPSNDSDEEEIKKAVDRSISWAKRCRVEFDRQVKRRKLNDETRPILFGVVQGGMIKEERRRCSEALIEIGFDGLGFGARPVDAQGNFLEEILQYTADLIPDDYIKFALGVGTPEDILRCYEMGWDMFDCVIPTREGRHGRLFQFSKKSFDFYKTINIMNSGFKEDFSPINKDSAILELREYSKSYLHHLFKVRDPLSLRLASLNNLEFYLGLMKKIQDSIKNNDF